MPHWRSLRGQADASLAGRETGRAGAGRELGHGYRRFVAYDRVASLSYEHVSMHAYARDATLPYGRTFIPRARESRRCARACDSNSGAPRALCHSEWKAARPGTEESPPPRPSSGRGAALRQVDTPRIPANVRNLPHGVRAQEASGCMTRGAVLDECRSQVKTSRSPASVQIPVIFRANSDSPPSKILNFSHF